MKKAQEGDTVRVHYKGTLDDGTVFDTSQDREPLEFTLGDGRLIPGFDNNVRGMEVNEKKNINIPAVDAYGDRRDDLILEFPKSEIPESIKPEVGQKLQLTGEDGRTTQVTVTSVNEDNIEIDANHPLAGKDLNFEIELVEILA